MVSGLEKKNENKEFQELKNIDFSPVFHLNSLTSWKMWGKVGVFQLLIDSRIFKQASYYK